MMDLKEMNDRLLSILKCPTCSDYIMPPISMCSNGHTICKTCFSKLSSCSTCKAWMGGRNYAMEEVAELVMYPCKYASAGCDVKLSFEDKEKHERDCLFRSFQCLFTDCRLKVSRPDYLHHLKNTHLDRLIVGTDHVFLFSTRKGGVSEWVYSAFDRFFLVKSFTWGDKLKWTVIYEGSHVEASKFYFTSNMSDPKEPYHTIQYSRTTDSIEVRGEGVYRHSTIIDNFLLAYCDRADTMSLPVEIKLHKIP